MDQMRQGQLLDEVADNSKKDTIPVQSSQESVPVKPSRKAPGAFLTISEVAEKLDVQQHVLRFWETKFSQLKPLKRGGGRRYYRPEDVALLEVIHGLLYSDKYTIKGAQKLLKGQSKMQILQGGTSNNNARPSEPASNDQYIGSNAANTFKALSSPRENLNSNQKALLKDALKDLKELRDIISGGR